MAALIKYKKLILIIITILVFSPSLFNDFQEGWDDQWMLLEQPLILNFSWEDLWYEFGYFYHSQYSPVNTVFYLLIHSLFGFNASAFHAGCLLVHLLNVLLVFSIIRIVIEKVKPVWKSNRIEIYAGLVALIFAIHPLQVESIAWISASKVILYGYFSLLGLWCYLKYIKSMDLRWLIGVIFCYLLAFGSKEQAIIFPLNLIVLDWVLGRYKGIGINLKSIFHVTILEKIPFFILAWSMWLFSLQNGVGNLDIGTYPLYQRLFFSAHCLIEYIFRFIAPVKLYYFYFFPVNVGEELPLIYWIYPFLVVLVLFFLWANYKKRNYLVILGFLFFVVNLLLVLHLVPLRRNTITADRYIYLSIPGIALAGVWLVDYLYQRYTQIRKMIITMACVLGLAFCIQSFARTTEWNNSKTLKRNISEIVEKRKKNKEAIVNNPLEKATHETQ